MIIMLLCSCVSAARTTWKQAKKTYHSMVEYYTRDVENNLRNICKLWSFYIYFSILYFFYYSFFGFHIYYFYFYIISNYWCNFIFFKFPSCVILLLLSNNCNVDNS